MSCIHACTFEVGQRVLIYFYALANCTYNYNIETVITDVKNTASSISVTWNAVPLTEYCVNINRTTINSSETVIPNPACDITNHFNFTYTNHSVCDRFSFTVTPTDGGRRGTTSEPETGFFTRAEGVGNHMYVIVYMCTYLYSGCQSTSFT